MGQLIVLLQRVVIKSAVYEFGHEFEYTRKRIEWVMKHKINHKVVDK